MVIFDYFSIKVYHYTSDMRAEGKKERKRNSSVLSTGFHICIPKDQAGITELLNLHFRRLIFFHLG